MTRKEQSMIDNRVACYRAGYPSCEAMISCSLCYWGEEDKNWTGPSKKERFECKLAECNFMPKRGNWKGANPASWDPTIKRCEVCGKENTELRIVHKGPFNLDRKDHIAVCYYCFHYSDKLDGWFACGCGG